MLFPEPLAPTIATLSPFFILRLILFNTTFGELEYLNVKFLISKVSISLIFFNSLFSILKFSSSKSKN